MRIPDNRQRFLLESCDVRGQIVQLDTTWQEAIARTDYPPRVRQVLGEAFVAAALLAGSIKFDGKMTLQIRGSGPINLLVVQVTHDGSMRGLARWQNEPDSDDLIRQFGSDARMVITIESASQAEPYQGIVPLQGDRFSDALKFYFDTSEQLKTEMILAVSSHTAAGMLIQKLPVDERLSDDNDGWQTGPAC